MNMKGKIAFVTGASSGIGQAIAEQLAKAGYAVYGTSRRGGDTGQRLFEMLPLDVTKDESVDAAVVVKAAMAAHPKIHYAPGLASRMRLRSECARHKEER